MLNISNSIFSLKATNANIDTVLILNSSENVEEFELPVNYSTCLVKKGSIEANGSIITNLLYYSPDITKININANTEIIIFKSLT